MQPPTPAAEFPAVPWLRRLFRPKFSLRTLLLGMLVLGAGLGLFQRLDRQRQLVARIKAAGGRCVYYRYESSGRFETWLRKRLPRSYFDDVLSIELYKSTEKLDGILVSLAELKSLKAVNLDDTQVSDAGLAHLVELKSLEGVSLNNTHVSDTGLAHLAELKSLTGLCLQDTQVSDAGLPHLAELKSLESLDLNHTKISDPGIQQLKTSLPNCQITGP